MLKLKLRNAVLLHTSVQQGRKQYITVLYGTLPPQGSPPVAPDHEKVWLQVLTEEQQLLAGVAHQHAALALHVQLHSASTRDVETVL